MNPLFWTVLISFIMAAHAYMIIHHYRNRRTRASRQQIPLIFALLVGPLYYFILTNHQLKERRSFMKGKRRFS
jgi:hypothetical protein